MWVSRPNESYEITGYNTYFNEASQKQEIWVTKANGKTAKIMEGTPDEIKEIYTELEFAMLNGVKFFNIH